MSETYAMIAGEVSCCNQGVAMFHFCLNFFLICIVGGGGGVDANWGHTAMRPQMGLLCQPRVIMMMEKLVE
jgi:hypothetical protein